MDLKNQEQLHVRQLSSTEKSVFHLGLLLLQTDFLLDAGIHDDLLQGGRNLRRIKHVKIRESTPSNRLQRHKIVH